MRSQAEIDSNSSSNDDADLEKALRYIEDFVPIIP